MFLTHSLMGWSVLAVLSISVPVWSSVKVTQPYRVVSTNGTAQIHCIIHSRTVASHLRPGQRLENLFSNLEDLQVALLRGLHGNQKICSSTLNTSEHQKEMQQEKDGDGRCAVQMKDGAVVVTLSGLKATHTDIYRCTIQVFYPPPYQQLTGNGTLLHVLEDSPCPVRGPQRQQSEEDEGEEEESNEKKPAVSVVVVVLVIAIICVLIIIITLQTLQCERGRREPIRMPSNVLLHKVDAVPFSCGTMA
ncbi:cytotoxic T-lymphocyte protein 4 [Poecilia reticulata]|uniref:cytotoxic T-lymphocyte protein 4 n=1 Tax=Poecilia reticulata TaxID=8081 RepID=UPI0004A4DC11|nr:PREDICTED: cytotoxic T-lymphocyte protein 4-like [Poecilia reticulata]